MKNNHKKSNIKIAQHFSFSQIYKLSDLKVGGSCFAYMVLYLTYLNMHRLQPHQTDLDYPSLIRYLKQFDQNQKQALQKKQQHPRYLTEDNVTNFKALFDAELAVLNHNTLLGPTSHLLELVQIIRDDLKARDTGVFYSLSVDDVTQCIAQQSLSHVVGLYIAGDQQLHFFDANSGFYILQVPEDETPEAFAQTLLELIFKKNSLFKWFFNATAPTIQFEMVRSAPQPQLTHQHALIIAHLTQTQATNALAPAIELTKVEKEMVDRHLSLWQQMMTSPNAAQQPMVAHDGVLARLHRIGHY